MDRVYLDCTGLPNSIPVRSDLPNSIYVDASDLQRVLSDFLQQLPNAIEEGLKANPVENRVSQAASQAVPSELLPCPFCGGKFDFVKQNLADGKELFAGGCYNICSASPRIGWFGSLDYIKQMWNKRASQ